MSQTRREFLQTTAAIGAASVLAQHGMAAPQTNGKRWNIVWIMSDDHTTQAFSTYGSQMNNTPNLDRIAGEGMRFEKCFCTNAICTPSRATLITGKYSHLNGVPVFNCFDGNQPTVAKYLQAGGYHTGVVGKWHLGSVPTGYDYWDILPGQGVYWDPAFYSAKGREEAKGFVTDIITDKALNFLKNRPEDKPFFLMYQHKAPHRSWESDKKHLDMFIDKDIPEPPTLYDDYATRTDAIHNCTQKVFKDLTRRDLKLEPPAGLTNQERLAWLKVKPTEVETVIDGKKVTLTGDALNKFKYETFLRYYLACCQGIDDNVGRLLKYLDDSGLAENTVVFYTADHGFFLGEHGLFDKRFMYEQALRVPLLVRWPGAINPGRVENSMALNVDFAPTILDIAGIPTPPDMQGRSLVPLMKGSKPENWRTSMYYRYYHDPGDHNTARHMGVRTETHKLIYFWKLDQWECYDLVKDPREMNNVYNDPAYKDVVAELKAEMYRLKKELKDDDQFANQIPPPSVEGAPRPNKPV